MFHVLTFGCDQVFPQFSRVGVCTQEVRLCRSQAHHSYQIVCIVIKFRICLWLLFLCAWSLKVANDNMDARCLTSCMEKECFAPYSTAFLARSRPQPRQTEAANMLQRKTMYYRSIRNHLRCCCCYHPASALLSGCHHQFYQIGHDGPLPFSPPITYLPPLSF